MRFLGVAIVFGGFIVNVTGVALPVELLHERSLVPTNELVYLADKVLRQYHATKLITSLEPGWEQALAKAAIELQVPLTVALPYPGRDRDWKKEVRVVYYELLSRAAEVFQISDSSSPTALLECHFWQTDQSVLVLALWDFDFHGETYAAVKYAVNKGVTVSNHWQDWQALYTLRKETHASVVYRKPKGAQVFNSEG
jgi:uncharacterized phage-like protein YoqJ